MNKGPHIFILQVMEPVLASGDSILEIIREGGPVNHSESNLLPSTLAPDLPRVFPHTPATLAARGQGIALEAMEKSGRWTRAEQAPS